MVSSLASQLAQGSSLNSSLLVDRTKRKPTSSYLFTGRDADQHDLASIHALASNALLQLKQLSPQLGDYEDALFSDAVKDVDRTLLQPDAVEELNANIRAFLPLLGPYVMEVPTGKILEWLVRRFRINEFNVEDILALFLPYHESPHFAKMVTILHIRPNSPYAFLGAYKSAAQPVPRTSLVLEMQRSTDLARFAASLLPKALKEGPKRVHRALIAFHTGTLLDYIAKSKLLEDETLAFILPAMLEPLQSDFPSKEIILANTVLLCALSQKTSLTPSALKTIVGILASCASSVTTQQFVHAAVALLSPQEPIGKLSSGVVSKILALPDVDGVLIETFTWAGSENLVGALIPGLVNRLSSSEAAERAFSFLDSLLTSPNTPTTILRQITSPLLSAAISEKSTTDHQRLLSSLHQRHPHILQEATQKAAEDDENAQDAVEQLVLSLSTASVLPQTAGKKGSEIDMVVASAVADPQAREKAVRNMIQTLSQGTEKLSNDDKDSISNALLARVYDTSPKVIAALYSKPATIAPVLLTHASTYITALTSTLAGKPHANSSSRQVLRAHVLFLADHFTPRLSAAQTKDVFARVVFPLLLFSKPRQKSALAVWEILDVSEAAQGESDGGAQGIRAYELLGGCVDVVRWEEGQVGRKRRGGTGGLESMQVMGNANLAMAAKMAETILVSNDHAAHFSFLLEKLRSADSHARNLAFLIMRALLGHMSGAHKIQAARRTLDAMALETLEGMGGFMGGADNLQEFLNDHSLGRNVVVKPNSRNTLHWLQTAVLAMMPITPRPMNVQLEWVDGGLAGDDVGTSYVHFMRCLYILANSSSTLPFLSASLLRAQFMNLADDALAFLLGLFLSTKNSRCRHAALAHAAAFIAAHDSTEHAVDFQTVLPMLLIALEDPERGVRSAAVECVLLIGKLSAGKKATGVYAFDTIYGGASNQLQYLDWADFQKYIKAIGEFKDHFLNDANYVQIFQQQHLLRTRSDLKKEAAYKRRVLCYFVSHATACRLPQVKIDLLRMLDDVSDITKVQTLTPVLQNLADDAQSAELETLFGAQFEQYAALLVSSFDASAPPELNEPSGNLWPVFVKVLRRYLRAGATSEGPRHALLHRLQHGLFAGLSQERKLEVCNLLLEVGMEHVDAQNICKSALSSLLSGVDLLVQLLNGLQPAPKEHHQRAPKRAKVDASTPAAPTTLAKLSLLAEVLSSLALPGSLDLLSCLLDTLNKVANAGHASQADVVYVEQLLMSAVENVAAHIETGVKVPTSAIRLEILVDIIRVAENPQTFHQALLLMTNLARLAPESVLHHIMPVFTFMGANVFHRDDVYSFRVVQMTVDNIVPVMVSSLREKHAVRLDLQIASRDFLHIFTDAANHIPRHRRTHFFTHLVDVLGHEDFLAPLCVLMVGKVTNKVVRQQGEELLATLSLPLSVIHHHSPTVQINALAEVLAEARRVLSHAANPESDQATISDLTRDDDQPSQISVFLKRRVQAFITFTGIALESSTSQYTIAGGVSSDSVNHLMAALLSIASIHDGSTAEGDGTNIAKVAHVAIRQCLLAMSPVHFVSAVLAILKDEEVSVKSEALRLFADSVGAMSDSARRYAMPTIISIVQNIKDILSAQIESLVSPALSSVKAVAVSTISGEEGALADCVPLVILALREAKHAAVAVTVLPSLCTKLGPRVIPYFRDIIEQCVDILQNGANAASDVSPNLVNDSLDAMNALFAAIPTFWGKPELSKVVHVYLEFRALSTTPERLHGFVKTLAKKAPSAVVIATLCDIWPSLQDSQESRRFEVYSDLLKRAIRAANRALILENVRPLFKIFLEAFDVRSKLSSDDISEVEQTTISAFIELVTKLNETAFKPLFRKLFDWAFTDSSVKRKITLCHIYMTLLDFFKALMIPYLSFVLAPFITLLQDDSTNNDYPELWICVVGTLAKSFSVDEGTFWREEKLRQVIPALISQLPKCVDFRIEEGKEQMSAALIGLAEVVEDDNLLKKINLDVLMHTRSEEVRVRLFALQCSEALWTAHGTKFMGYVPETATFVAECAEDENDSVVQATHKLKNAVEKATGERIDSM